MDRRQFLRRLLFTASGLYLAPSLVLPYEPKTFYSIPRNVTVFKDYPYISFPTPDPFFVGVGRDAPVELLYFNGETWVSLSDKKSEKKFLARFFVLPPLFGEHPI